MTSLPGLEDQDDHQRREDDEERNGARQRAQRIDIRVGHSGRETLQIKRQRIDRTDNKAPL